MPSPFLIHTMFSPQLSQGLLHLNLVSINFEVNLPEKKALYTFQRLTQSLWNRTIHKSIQINSANLFSDIYLWICFIRIVRHSSERIAVIPTSVIIFTCRIISHNKYGMVVGLLSTVEAYNTPEVTLPRRRINRHHHRTNSCPEGSTCRPHYWLTWNDICEFEIMFSMMPAE